MDKLAHASLQLCDVPVSLQTSGLKGKKMCGAGVTVQIDGCDPGTVAIVLRGLYIILCLSNVKLESN